MARHKKIALRKKFILINLLNRGGETRVFSLCIFHAHMVGGVRPLSSQGCHGIGRIWPQCPFHISSQCCHGNGLMIRPYWTDQVLFMALVTPTVQTGFGAGAFTLARLQLKFQFNDARKLHKLYGAEISWKWWFQSREVRLLTRLSKIICYIRQAIK